MGLLTRIKDGIMIGWQTFKQVPANDATGAALFDSYPERVKRYESGRAYYEGAQYNRSNALMNRRMIDKALYKYIQDIYNPTARLVNFYKGVIWRGSIDPQAGDKGAIPITVNEGTNEAQARAAIAHVFKVSSLNKNKNIHVLHGASLGDGILYIRDDVDRGHTRIEVVHPAEIERAEFDGMGNVKSYVIKQARLDNSGFPAVYREVCEHGDNDDIIFRTFKDWSPYAWDTNTDETGSPRYEWVVPYGFVPLVLTKHIDEGYIWGRSAAWNSISKIDAIEDEASMLHDQIRKTIDPAILANFKMSSSEVRFGETTATTDKPRPGRETSKVIGVDFPEARMTPIITPLDIAGVSANIRQMLDNLENELPELRREISSNVATDTVLAARAQVESKVIEARINYDASMLAALQMAITIGGMRGYKGYEGFNETSFKDGKMNFVISDRDVFPESEGQEKAEKQAFWATVGTAIQSSQGMLTFEMIAKSYGWTDEKITEYTKMRMPSVIDSAPIDPVTGGDMGQ
jgi:hypothetical protein